MSTSAETFTMSLVVLLAPLGVALPAASGQWVEFVDETATRLPTPLNDPALSTSDPEEKDYAWGDVDQDGDVDFDDFNVFLTVYNGPLEDCNTNTVLDLIDILNGTSPDANGNGIPDECETPRGTADLNGDGCADSTDLTILLGAWCSAVNDPIPPSPPCENCTQANLDAADIAGSGGGPSDGCVDSNDLTKLLGEWCSVASGNPCGTCF